jgi:hydrogenase/urease accessory protein HupE
MSRITSALLAIWEFIVGDDWRTAVGVVVAIGLTAAIAAAGVPAWWVMPIAVVVLLVVSIRRALRPS